MGMTESISFWMNTPVAHKGASLRRDVTADVCVIGAGIAGFLTAYRMAREGYSVTVLDAEKIGGLETPHTTAHLSWVLGDPFFKLASVHSEEEAGLIAKSHDTAIDEYENIVHAEKISCQFERVNGYLFPDCPETEGDLSSYLRQELEMLRKIGRTEVHAVSRLPFPSFDTGMALRFRRQAQFHPLQFISGLEPILLRKEVRFFPFTRVVEVEEGSPCVVHTADGKKVYADWVAVCTNTPINDRFKVHTKQAGYRTYAIAAKIPRGVLPHALYWDTSKPYHYVRVAGPDLLSSEESLIIGGEDHKTGQVENESERLDNLEGWARVRFPEIQQITHRWSGQVMESVDGIAFIGRNPGQDKILIATGDCGNGMTHGMIAGMLLSDIMMKRPNPWQNLYDPSRRRLKAVGEYAKENGNTLMQYAAWIRDYPTAYETKIAPGEGKVVTDDGHKIALYRDKTGVFHACSAVCPHLGGIVHWNAFEKSWDCPCHSSRFDPEDGKVMHGPATKGLQLA